MTQMFQAGEQVAGLSECAVCLPLNQYGMQSYGAVWEM
jgi:hypothetical protein